MWLWAAKKSKLEETEGKRKTRYSKEYEKEYGSVRKRSSGFCDSDYKFHCMTCNIESFSTGEGRNDIDKHSLSESHRNFKVMTSKHCEIFFVIYGSAFFHITENYQTILLISAYMTLAR